MSTVVGVVGTVPAALLCIGVMLRALIPVTVRGILALVAVFGRRKRARRAYDVLELLQSSRAMAARRTSGQ
jgi:hypothetical protein